MEFAVTFKGDIDPQRTVELCKQAEAAGFTTAWFFDSHVLWQECFTTMSYCMAHTKNLRYGTCVTNPGVRDWTVTASLFATMSKLGGGNVDMGIGRGDSSRRVLKKKPMTLAHMNECVNVVRKLAKGETVELDGVDVEFPWANEDVPVWIAAYGPKALKSAGENGDGLIIQLADPWLVDWFAGQSREAAKATGKDPNKFQVMAAAPAWVSDDVEFGRDQIRWFPAMVGNHVADLVEKYGTTGVTVPERLTKYIEGRKGYDYKHHADKDADHLDFISDDIIESFGINGPPAAHIKKLQELKDIGVTQYNIYLMCGDEERIVEEYGKNIIPAFKS
jgi:probable F420-dependent oxidoreductase